MVSVLNEINFKIKYWCDECVNMGFLTVPHPLCNLLFEPIFRSVGTDWRVMHRSNMAFAPWRVKLLVNAGDVMARQAEGLV